jgi:DNA-binding NarL/FixJ family response regulator
MSGAVLAAARPLDVGVIAASESERAQLARIVEEAGHRVVAAEQAEVILSDAKRASMSTPILVLSRDDSLAENHLPIDAERRQIDAALRALAAGLSIRAGHSTPPRGFEALAESTTQSVLTPRELDVIDAIGAGLSNKAIARELGISLHTVKFHIESLLRKLGARTRAEAVAKAMEQRRRQTIEL